MTDPTGTRQRAFARMFRGIDSTQYYHGIEQATNPSHSQNTYMRQNGGQYGIGEFSNATAINSHDALKFETDQVLNKVDSLELQQHRTHTDLKLLHEEQELDKKTKRDWYPWVLFSIAVNFFLWIAMLYAIFDAQFWGHNKSLYLTYAWLIVIGPLLIVSFLVFSRVPASLKTGRDRFSETVASPHAKNLINILNAAACFIAAATYLFHSAIPQYNSIDWSMSVNFVDSMPIPAVAILIDTYDTDIVTDDDIAQGWLTDGYGDWTEYDSSGVYIYDGHDYGTNKMLVWNSTALPNATADDPTNDYIWLQTNVTFNASGFDYGWNGMPQIWVVAFDPRLSVGEMLDCGLQPWYLMNAFSTNSYSIQVNYLVDTLHSVQAPSGDPEYCSKVFSDKLSRQSPPFALYDMRLSGSSPTTASYQTDCNVATNSSARCPLQINLSYGSQFVLTQSSSHSVSKLDIWLNIGAIVGAIQFFAWFVLQAVGG